MEMDDHKRRRNMILYVIIAMAIYLVLSTYTYIYFGQHVQISQVSYTQLLKDLEDKKVDTVQYTTDDASVVYTRKGDDEGIAYETTAMPTDAQLTDRINDAGATLDVVVPSNDSNMLLYFPHLLQPHPHLPALWLVAEPQDEEVDGRRRPVDELRRRFWRHGRGPRQERCAYRGV